MLRKIFSRALATPPKRKLRQKHVKHICDACKKVFPSEMALDQHRSDFCEYRVPSAPAGCPSSPGASGIGATPSPRGVSIPFNYDDTEQRMLFARLEDPKTLSVALRHIVRCLHENGQKIAFPIPEAHDRLSLRSVGLPTVPEQLLELVRRSFTRRNEEEFKIQPVYADFVKAHGRLSFDPKKSYPECYTTTRAPGVTSCPLDRPRPSSSSSPPGPGAPIQPKDRTGPVPASTGDTERPTDTSRSKCKSCGRTFEHISLLQAHQELSCHPAIPNGVNPPEEAPTTGPSSTQSSALPSLVATIPDGLPGSSRVRCDACGRSFASRKTLLRHQREHCPARNGAEITPPASSSSTDVPPPERVLFVCEDCRSEYDTVQKLKQHRRYYCHPDEQLVCKWCDRDFPTKIGLAQHCRHAHRSEREAEIEEGDNHKKSGFSSLEIYHMVSAELQHTGKNILLYLSERFGHDRAAIIALRRTKRYKSELERIKADIEEALPETQTSPTPTPPPSPSRVEALTDVSHAQEEVFAAGPPDDDPPPTPASSPQPAASPRVPSSQPPDLPPSPPPNSPEPRGPGEDIEDDPVAAYLQLRLIDPDTDPEDAALLRPLLARPRDPEPILEEFLSRITGRQSPPERRVPPPQSKMRAPRSVKEARKQRYRQAQNLYKTNRAALAERIIGGISLDNQQACPSLEQIQQTYEEVFAADESPERLSIQDAHPPLAGIYTPVTDQDVQDQLRTRMSDAAGPDGLHLRDIRRIPVRQLSLLYNAMLVSGATPPALRRCRTTLIPKGDADHQDVNNWRPITVGPLITRIFHRILARRLEALPLHQAQRGFVSLDGTLANAVSLWAIVRQQREATKPYHITTLDLKKAFDTVPHIIVERALQRLGVDRRFIQYAMSSLRGWTTTISCGPHTSTPIPILRGVRQGDPISPLLFNAVMDELICRLDSSRSGIELGGSKFAVLAYADDLVLVSSSVDDQQHLVRATERFLRQRCMRLNRSKCTHVSVNLLPARKKLYTAVSSRVYLGADPVPQIGSQDLFKYLGLRFHPAGLQKPDEVALTVALNRVEQAPLKPWQKLDIIQTYLLPRFFYCFQTPEISGKVLDMADKAIKRCIKKVLHLPESTANAFLYADTKSGGLGIPCFSARMPDILLKRLENLSKIEDPQLQSILNSDCTLQLAQRLAAMCQQYGFRDEQRSYWRGRLEASLPCAGLAAHCAPREASNWIRSPPPFWDGSTYIKSIQLRAGVLPTQGGLHNQHLPFQERRCRAGCQAVETTSHILQKCPITHYERIRRHDNLVDILAKAGRRVGWEVSVEPRYRDEGGRLRKPDLVFKKGSCLVITDVTVAWERPEPLDVAYENKVAIYSDRSFLNAVRARHPGCDVHVTALAMGARGTWCSKNYELLDTLDLDAGIMSSLINSTLRGGIYTHSAFNRLVWRRQN